MGEPAKKKPGLALVVEMSKAKKGSEPDGDEPEAGAEDDGGEFEAACDELSSALGVPDDKREAVCTALRAAIMSCK